MSFLTPTVMKTTNPNPEDDDMGVCTVGQAVEEIAVETGVRVRPKAISDLLYAGAIRQDLCPVVSGRRLISRVALPNLIMALRRAGKL